MHDPTLPPRMNEAHLYADHQDHIESLAAWRQLSTYYLSEEVVQDHAASLVHSIASDLAPLRFEPSETFRPMLDKLVQQAAALALDLFRNPLEWKAVWTSSTKGGSLVLFPGLSFVPIREGGREQTRNNDRSIYEVCSPRIE